MQHLGEHGVFVLAATNNPWDIDVAFLRRFNATFYIPLPTLQDRILILKKLLENKRGVTDVEHHQLTEYDFEKLALFTDNYSGGHLRNLVEAALFFRLKRTQNATHFRRSVGRKGFMQPCTEEEPGSKKMPYKNVKNVHFPPVVMADMEKALYTSKPQIDKDHIRKLKDWGKKNSQMPNDM
jgi:SpoVK/Ycf46/Vps4 family AAA+-type ATPase